MAPEQLECGKVDSRTDLYALGAVLYECLVGHPPHRGETIEHLLYGIMNKEAVPLWKQHPEISVELSALVGRAISRDPAERFAEAKDMACALQPHSKREDCTDAATGGFDLSPAPNRRSWVRRAWSPRPRRFVVWGGVGAVLASLSVLSVVALRSAQPTAPTGNSPSSAETKMAQVPDVRFQGDQIVRPSPSYPTRSEISPPDAAPVQKESGSPAQARSERPMRQRGTRRARQNLQSSIIDAANPYDK
jgi:serine/threonine protein kinase